MSVQKETAKVIAERPLIIWFGCFPFIVKPLTLIQLWDIGAVTVNMPEVDQEKLKNLNSVSASLLYSDEAKKMSDIAAILIFRSTWKRKLFSGFIRKRLTMKKYKKLQNFMAHSMDATFFLSTIIFLKGVNEPTKPTNTPEATALGQQ